ncbi:MAG: hypothetical protein QF535_18050, partial [Anaerolineales bacterium]|nr:hypothetical protein [Anaerolineales bacterium]
MRIYYGKPVIYDDDRSHFMYPNEARLRNMTYGMTIHYDIEVEFVIYRPDDAGKMIATEESMVLEKILLGKFPIMMHSNHCILQKMDRMVRFNLGECKNDRGAYFIIDGKEKCMVSQEKFADNMLYVRDKVNDKYSYAADIRSASEDVSKFVRTTSVRIVAPTPTSSNNNIVVFVPNVRKPIPLFILMRALGVISDKEILEHIVLDLDANSDYLDFFIPCIHDAGQVFTQEAALRFIGTFTKGKSINHVMEILMNYFIPHVGELNLRDKALFIGHMTFSMVKVALGEETPTDRDNFKYKRVEVPGTLLYDLFREYYNLQLKNIYQKIDKEYYFHVGMYQDNFPSLMTNNSDTFFKERVVEEGFRKAFKGNWGAQKHTKKDGVVQDLNRLSFNSALSHLRKVNLSMDSSAKVTGPRFLHSSQWGIIDPVDTPDGGNVGLHKHMAITAYITSGYSAQPLVQWLHANVNMKTLNESTCKYLGQVTKVFVNGNWVGTITDPVKIRGIILAHRRIGLIPVYTSIHWDIQHKKLELYTDAGRLTRPLYYVVDDKNNTHTNNKGKIPS